MYHALNINEARRLMNEMLQSFEAKAPKAMRILEDGFADIMAVMALPKKYRKRLRKSNSIECLNEEIRRRERVIRVFPNEASAIRLIGALLIEQDEKWSSGKKYLDMNEYYDYVQEQSTLKIKANDVT